MEIWAHRGKTSPTDLGNNLRSLDILENTDITGIEVDIAFNELGRIMVFHPGINEPYLHFDTLLDRISQSDKKWFLDLKPTPRIPTHNSATLVRRAVTEITERGLQDKIYLTAFQRKSIIFGTESDGQHLILAKKFHPEIKTHLIVMWPWNLVKLVEKYQPDVISLGWLRQPFWLSFISKASFRMLNQMRNLKKQIKAIRKMNIKVLAGILNDTDEIFYMINLGIDGIVTDESLSIFKTFERQR